MNCSEYERKTARVLVLNGKKVVFAEQSSAEEVCDNRKMTQAFGRIQSSHTHS